MSTTTAKADKRKDKIKMKFTTTYKNGKPEYFYIMLDTPKEFAFLQPYFLTTSIDKKRRGRIKEMECLFSGSIFIGKQSHGYGYSCSHDVYSELINIIFTLYKPYLSEKAKKELEKINTHDDQLTITKSTLEEIQKCNYNIIRGL